MPYTKPDGTRDYRREYDLYASKPKAKKDRASRNKGRRMMAKKNGTTPKGLNGDVAHRKAMDKGGKTTLMNLFMESASGNRSFSRNSKSGLKSEVSKRERKKR